MHLQPQHTQYLDSKVVKHFVVPELVMRCDLEVPAKVGGRHEHSAGGRSKLRAVESTAIIFHHETQ